MASCCSHLSSELCALYLRARRYRLALRPGAVLRHCRQSVFDVLWRIAQRDVRLGDDAHAHAARVHHRDPSHLVALHEGFASFDFFGKIFRDYGYEGVFRLQDLKAQCENLPYPPEWFMDSLAHRAELQAFRNSHQTTMEPTRVYFKYNNFSYVTSGYAISEFSSEEWQSPAKTRKLDALKKAAADLDDPALEQRKKQ
jgi:hypothetical protein